LKKKQKNYGMNESLGRNWILLRGLARESAHWGDFIPLLQATFPDAKFTLLDLPGTGRFHRESSPSSIKAITETVRCHALANNFLKQPATILALSLGAMVAWEWMLSYPGEICGAALINTSLADLSPFYQRLRWQSYPKFIALTATTDLRNREKEILQLVSNFRAQDQQVIDVWQKIQTDRPVSIKNCFRQIVAAATYRPGNTKPHQSVLLLNGQCDHLVSANCSERIHKKWQLQLRSHPSAGHDLTLDDGDWVALQLNDWIVQKKSLTSLSTEP
jgi:pimeloyl-ACP methyl ester carboxylesterase